MRRGFLYLVAIIDWFTRKPLELPDDKDYEPFVTDETSRDNSAPEDEEAPAEE